MYFTAPIISESAVYMYPTCRTVVPRELIIYCEASRAIRREISARVWSRVCFPLPTRRVRIVLYRRILYRQGYTLDFLVIEYR